MNVIELRRKAAELREKIHALVTAPGTENRELSEDETAQVTEWQNEAERLGRRAKIVEDAEAGVEQARQSTGRTTEPVSGRIDPIASEDEKKVRTGGFRSAGHFAYAVYRGGHQSDPDERYRAHLNDYCSLLKRTATGANEAADPEGGLLVPAQYAQGIWDRTRDYENLADRIGMINVTGNSLTIPANAEKSRVNGSRNGGVQGFWQGEAAQYTSSKPTWRQLELKLKKLGVLVYATNELLEDAAALESYINRVAADEIAFKINDAVINGGGAGMPQGILSCDALVTVAAVSAQGAATLVAQNFTDIWTRVYAPSRRNGVWLMNQDAEGQLDGLKYSTGSSSGQLVYMPPTGISGATYATIKGRPVVTVEQCSTLGTVGDVIFADFTQYAGIMKSRPSGDGIESTLSIHLRFDFDETVFKFNLRMDAQPYWQSALTPAKGSNTQSPFVALSSSRT